MLCPSTTSSNRLQLLHGQLVWKKHLGKVLSSRLTGLQQELQNGHLLGDFNILFSFHKASQEKSSN